MANFKTMLVWLRDGRKVRRPMWDESAHLYLADNTIRNNRNEKVKFDNIDSLETDDWYISEEEWNLSKEILKACDFVMSTNVISTESVKKVVKKLEVFVRNPHSQREYEDKIHELFGDRLT